MIPLVEASLDHGILDFACSVVREGAEQARDFFASSFLTVSSKGGTSFDPVTEADRTTECLMRDRIASRFPEDGLLGEEFPEVPSRSGLTWVMDPIDGTASFVNGIPTWMTLLALLKGDEIVFGLACQPVLGELYVGTAQGSRLLTKEGDLPLKTRSCASLAEAMGGTTGLQHYHSERERAFYRHCFDGARGFRHDSDAYFYCMVARGKMDFAMDCGVHFHDIAALIPIVRGAGGHFSGWDGAAPCGGGGGRKGSVLASGDSRVHQEIVEEGVSSILCHR